MAATIMNIITEAFNTKSTVVTQAVSSSDGGESVEKLVSISAERGGGPVEPKIPDIFVGSCDL